MQRLRLGPHPGQWYILSPRTGVLQSRLWLLMLTGALTAGLAFIVTHVKSEPEPVQAAPNAQVSYTFSVVVSNNASREARIEISGAGSDVGDFRICIGSGSDQECRRLGRTSADYRTTIATTHGNTVPISAQVYECSDEECFSSFLSGSPRTVNATFTPHISSFSADDSSIDCDESTTIRWSLTNSNNFRVEQDAGDNNLRRTLVSRTINVFVNSSVGFTPRAVDCGRNVSISLNANGNSPGDSSQITIRVAVPRPPSIDSFSASDRSPAHDQDIRLTWTTSDAASASVRRCASGSTSFSSCTPLSTSLDGSVSDGPNSSSFIDPGETWYYEARAWNGTRGDCSDANTACSSRIAVTWGVAALDLFITASNRTPAANQSVTLNWGLNSGETTNLDFVLEATINNSAVYSGTSSSGSTTISGRTGGTVMRATFEAYVAGADPLTATPVDSAAVSVRWLAPVSVTIYASDETPSVGTAVRVQWRSLGVTEVEVTGPGINRTNLNCEGSCYVELSGRNDGGTVTITITGYLGDDPREAVATDSVTIDWDDPALTATLTASDTTPPANGSVTVTWNTSGAARVVVSGAISSTLRDGSLVLRGRAGGSVSTITLQAYRTVGQANPDLTRTVTIRWQNVNTATNTPIPNTATNTPVGGVGATPTPTPVVTTGSCTVPPYGLAVIASSITANRIGLTFRQPRVTEFYNGDARVTWGSSGRHHPQYYRVSSSGQNADGSVNPRILPETGNTVYFNGLEANTTYTLTYNEHLTWFQASGGGVISGSRDCDLSITATTLSMELVVSGPRLIDYTAVDSADYTIRLTRPDYPEHRLLTHSTRLTRRTLRGSTSGWS